MKMRICKGLPLIFTKRLREPIQLGKITCSIRIWMRPHVTVAGRYQLSPGHIEVTSLREIAFQDITPELARRSGFKGVVDLLKTAQHGRGRRVYLIEFRYIS